ncbi:hypothetical protein Sjap_002299 [Stephania japonica]|uniref:Uncharacterized protein n=1 Tax=Stephania japonica TaxID=461633 RepID=A0AAP0KNE5_9MAGN
MSVSQYMDRFRYLIMYAMDVANTERLQIYYFIRGLDERIGGVIVATGAETLQIVYDRALARETYLRHRVELGDGFGLSSWSDHRPKRQRNQSSSQEQDFRARRVRWQQDHDFINDRDLRNDQYDYDDGQIDWSREDDRDGSMINSIMTIAGWYMRLYLYRSDRTETVIHG